MIFIERGGRVKYINSQGNTSRGDVFMGMLTSTEKRVIGKHVYGELYGCDPELLMDEDYLTKVVYEAVNEGGFTLLDVKTWKIGPGISVIAIILESHIAIHTWPEYSFATVDVYTCGSRGDPFKSFEYIVKMLKTKNYTMRFSRRDYEEP